jgi:hypothetical protein
MLKITRTCPFTGKENTREVNCTLGQYRDWQSGVCIQDAMPQVSADDREFIKTGITPDVWSMATLATMEQWEMDSDWEGDQ